MTAAASHAIVPSPLGDVLLRADAGRLLGLYFIGQRDCPDLPGHASMHPAHFDPAAGTTQGRPTRMLKAFPPDAAAAGELPGLAQAVRPSRAQPMGRDLASSLQLQQAETPSADRAVLVATQEQLAEYFAGGRTVFDLPLAPQGTVFQRKVWQALLTIPCGTTVSYGEVARRAGLERRHSRAVGAAVGANPISIIIPCHRVLAGNGTLNGYGGGLDRKVSLLQLEGLNVR